MSNTKIFTGNKVRDFVSLLAWMDRVPPWKCRAMAMKKHWNNERMTPGEISELSGIPRRTVQRISYLASWAGVDVDVASRFAFACGVNLLAKKPERLFMRQRFKAGLKHLHHKQRKAIDAAAMKTSGA